MHSSRKLNNPQWLVLRILWSIVAGAVLCLVGAFTLEEPWRNLWIVGAVIAGVVLIPTLMCQFKYYPRTERRLQAFLRGDHLVHWQYRQPEWSAWQKFSSAQWSRQVRQDPEAFIGETGVYVAGQYSSWQLAGNYWLEEVRIQGPDPSWIEILICWENHAEFAPEVGSETVRVPVPEGRGAEAEKVIATLSGQVRAK